MTAVPPVVQTPSSPARAGQAGAPASAVPGTAPDFLAARVATASHPAVLAAAAAAQQPRTSGLRWLDALSQQRAGLDRAIERTVRIDARNPAGTPAQMLRAARLLSNYTVSTVFVAKVIGKATQTVDQLVRAQ
ncbi:EscI/YscI/HrpB family type III secretion system inner rod protein [Trinickia mobilis]|uniref:EscI/YscI/HrpB family type III secretion system inner rod protein n=1 Tax=Trinickia mobilis TaxID=2816356 RepID=UPI001A8C9738|nr:EscI/YscI/HrpB family type III secretion system inner rod protein [Trinickia mobilis]